VERLARPRHAARPRERDRVHVAGRQAGRGERGGERARRERRAEPDAVEPLLARRERGDPVHEQDDGRVVAEGVQAEDDGGGALRGGHRGGTVRGPTMSDPVRPAFDVKLPTRLEVVGPLRRVLEALLASLGWSEDDTADAGLIATEVIQNAVEHGSRNDGARRSGSGAGSTGRS
jgi:hypothetical protein